MKTRNIAIILMLTLFLTFMPVGIQQVYGAEFVKGQSLIAENQEEASRGLSFPGLDIRWLDLKGDHIQSYGIPEDFSEGVFSLRMSDGTLCFDTSGKIIVYGNYNGVYGFSDGVAKVYRYLPPAEPYIPGRIMAPPGRIEGFIDREGNEIIPLGKINGIGDKFSEGLAVIGGYEEKKGFIDKTGEIVILQEYKDARNFSDGLAAVQSAETELWGYIDREGRQVIPMIYEAAAPFNEGVAYAVKYGMAGYIDKEGSTVVDFKFIPEDNQFMDNSFYGGLAVARDSSGKYGYISMDGSFAIPAIYKEANPFIEDAAFVVSENQNYTNGYGSSFLINRDGERLTPMWQYGRYAGDHMNEGLMRAISSYGPIGNQYIVMLNKYGAEVIPSSLHIEHLSMFNEGYALMIAHNNGESAVGLVKLPENIEKYQAGKLIRVFIDGKLLDFTDTDPIIENSRTLVPMRAVFEALGAEITWDQENMTVHAKKGETTVSLKIDDNTGYINNSLVKLDTPAKIKNSRTIVPIRFIVESFNADVEWDASMQAVIITTK